MYSHLCRKILLLEDLYFLIDGAWYTKLANTSRARFLEEIPKFQEVLQEL